MLTKSHTHGRKSGKSKIQKTINILVVLALITTSAVLISNSLASVIQENNVRVYTDAPLTYYLSVTEDGVDANGNESNDYSAAEVKSGRIYVTDRIPDDLIFEGFTTTADGTFGATLRNASAMSCPGRVVDDTNEAITDSGTWANENEYYYHGLHYNATTRTVSFVAENIGAGCELTVGVKVRTPSSIDNPATDFTELRRDFYNTASVSEKNVSAISNTVHFWLGDSPVSTYTVSYSYTGDVPPGAPATPADQKFTEGAIVRINANPTLSGYTFSGWTTSDVTITDGTFSMPAAKVNLVGIWTQNLPAATHQVSYIIDGDTKPQNHKTTCHLPPRPMKLAQT